MEEEIKEVAAVTEDSANTNPTLSEFVPQKCSCGAVQFGSPIFALHQKVLIVNPHFNGTVVGICLDEHGSYTYHVRYWNEGTRHCLWLNATELAETGNNRNPRLPGLTPMHKSGVDAYQDVIRVFDSNTGEMCNVESGWYVWHDACKIQVNMNEFELKQILELNDNAVAIRAVLKPKNQTY